jgi:hypothetical protein
VPFGLEVTDDRLDRRSASQFALDDAEYAALLARDEDAAWMMCIVPLYPLSTWPRSISQRSKPLAACRTDAFSRLATIIVSPAIGKMAAVRTGSETILGILNQSVGSLSG